jgi:hypothetical protein
MMKSISWTRRFCTSSIFARHRPPGSNAAPTSPFLRSNLAPPPRPPRLRKEGIKMEKAKRRRGSASLVPRVRIRRSGRSAFQARRFKLTDRWGYNNGGPTICCFSTGGRRRFTWRDAPPPGNPVNFTPFVI